MQKWSTLKKLIWLRATLLKAAAWVIEKITGSLPLTITNAVAHAIEKLTRYGLCTQPSGIWNTAITQEGKVEQRNLPRGYTELTYLQSNGTQLLQLDITRQSGKAYAMQADLEASVFGSTSSGLFTLGSDYAGYCVVSRKWNTTNMVMMSGSVESSGLAYTGRATYTVSVATDGLSCTLSDGTNTASYTRTTANYSNKPVLFGLDASYKGTCKIYSAKLWEDDVLKFDLVPCMNADGVCGMFNRVDGSFIAPYVGSLAAGDVVTPSPEHSMDIVTNNGALKVRRQSGMPLAYQMVEWLKPTDAIPITGFKTKSTQEITAVFYRESSTSSYLYWSDTASSGTTNTTAYLTTSGGNWRWDGKTYSIGVSSGIKITSVQNKDGVWLNGTKYGYYTDAGEFVSTNDLSLASYTNTAIRIYSMTIREGETVTLDLVPVQRVLDNAYGFYDKVSGNFYTNPDATFEAGDPISDPVEIYTDGTPEVLTVGGANLFDASSYTEINAYVDANTGVLMAGTSGSLTQYCAVIPCKPNTQYNITGQGASTWGAFTTDSIGTRATAFTKGGNLTTGANDRYLIGLVRANGDSIDYRNTLVVQEAQTVTGIPMLLGVGNRKDTAEILGGLKTGKVGIKVFNGTETFTISSSGAMITAIPDVAIGAQNVPMNTHFALETSPTTIGVGTQRFGASGTQILSSNYYMKHPTITTDTDFKAWLADQYANGKPVIVLYPLATATTEQITAYPQLCNKLYNTADVTAEVDDISVTFTTGEQTVPSPYSQLPIMCNNGELKWNGTTVAANGTPEVLIISGANLLDPSTSNIVIGESISANGQPATGTNNWRTGYIPVAGGKTYIFYGRRKSDDVISAYSRINFYTADKTAISPRPNYEQSTPTVATAPSNAAYVRLSSAPYNSANPVTRDTFDDFNWMFAEANSEIPYVPYVQPQTVSVPMLLGVGDYKDAAELISGIKTGRVSVKVLDGTEGWTKGSASPLNYYYGGDTNLDGNAEKELMCNQFAIGTRNVPAIGKICVRNARNGFLITPNDQTLDTTAKFKQWLAAQYAAGTPVIVLYPLATETTEQGTAQPINTSEGTNTIDSTSNVSPIDVEIEYAAKKGA